MYTIDFLGLIYFKNMGKERLVMLPNGQDHPPEGIHALRHKGGVRHVEMVMKK